MRITTKLTGIGEIEEAMRLKQRGIRSSSNGAVTLPRTPIEEMLVQIWMEVLRIEKIGVQDNFFELGGNSLLGTVLISRARKVFEVELTLHSLFDHPTVSGLAEIIERDLISQFDPDEANASAQSVAEMSDEEVAAQLREEDVG